MKYKIRFNKTRGQPGRGSVEHVWRVFSEDKEYLFKHIDITTPVKSEKELGAEDWNIVCHGQLQIDRENSVAKIVADKEYT
jgi:hypothetical protein